MSAMLRYKFLILVTLLLSLPAASQVKRVNHCNPMPRPQASCGEAVYESDYVDVQPQFPGGNCALTNFINKTRHYPYDAYKKRVQGRVLCSFIVNTDGSLSNISVVRGVDAELNREAVRVISEMPRWHAGSHGGNTVAVRCLLPIAFRL